MKTVVRKVSETPAEPSVILTKRELDQLRKIAYALGGFTRLLESQEKMGEDNCASSLLEVVNEKLDNVLYSIEQRFEGNQGGAQE